MTERQTTSRPATTRSSLVLETAAEMIRERGFWLNQSIEQVLKCYGFSVADILSWGGAVVPSSQMSFEPGRTGQVRTGEVDAIFDEAVPSLIPQLDDLGMHLLPLEEPVLQQMDDIGFHR